MVNWSLPSTTSWSLPMQQVACPQRGCKFVRPASAPSAIVRSINWFWARQAGECCLVLLGGSVTSGAPGASSAVQSARSTGSPSRRGVVARSGSAASSSSGLDEGWCHTHRERRRVGSAKDSRSSMAGREGGHLLREGHAVAVMRACLLEVRVQ